jgi:hypothetical protein
MIKRRVIREAAKSTRNDWVFFACSTVICIAIASGVGMLALPAVGIVGKSAVAGALGTYAVTSTASSFVRDFVIPKQNQTLWVDAVDLTISLFAAVGFVKTVRYASAVNVSAAYANSINLVANSKVSKLEKASRLMRLAYVQWGHKVFSAMPVMRGAHYAKTIAKTLGSEITANLIGDALVKLTETPMSFTESQQMESNRSTQNRVVKKKRSLPASDLMRRTAGLELGQLVDPASGRSQDAAIYPTVQRQLFPLDKMPNLRSLAKAFGEQLKSGDSDGKPLVKQPVGSFVSKGQEIRVLAKDGETPVAAMRRVRARHPQPHTKVQRFT